MTADIPTLTTQIHCLSDSRILLLKRTQPPNRGCWAAPGGKLERGESPWECARRELNEETGLSAETLHLSGLVTLVIPRLAEPALLFLFTVTEWSGEIIPRSSEGDLQWWSFAEAIDLDLPQANRVYLPRVLSLEAPFYQAKYIYDESITLVSVVEHA